MSIYTLRSGGTAHPEDSVLQYFSDLIVDSGVRDLSSDNHLKVTEKGTGANMSVDVAAGHAMIKGSGNAYPVRSTATENVLIASNSSGNPRIDSIVLYVNLAATPNSDSSNVAVLLRVAGTPAASPSAPSDADIQTAVGASNPFLRLADVAVANGAAQILDANITDKRIRHPMRHSNRFQEVAGANTITPDFSEYNIQEFTLDRATTTFNEPTGVSPNEAITVNLKQDSTGNRAVVWWNGINWYGGTPTITPTANRVDSFGFIKRVAADGDISWDGYILGQDKEVS